MTTKKARFAPRLQAPFVFYYDSGLDIASDIFWAAKYIGILVQKGAWYEIRGIPAKAKKFNGKAKWPAYYARTFSKHMDWFELQLERYWIKQWAHRCRQGGNEPEDVLKAFGKEVYKRSWTRIQKVSADLGEDVLEDETSSDEEAEEAAADFLFEGEEE